MGRTIRRLWSLALQRIGDVVVRWRSGSTEGQILMLAAVGALATALFVVSMIDYERMPLTGFFLPLLLGTLLLRFRPLLVLVTIVAVMVAITVWNAGTPTTSRITAAVIMTLSVMLILFGASRHRSGLPGPLGEEMLVDLRDRLQSQGAVPALPAGWQCQTATQTSGGLKFAGDFLVANLSDDERQLEVILVDVCGKGVAAGAQALQLAGALGGLIGSLPPVGLVAAANSFLLRQKWSEGFATAVHVSLDLDTGAYAITNAGHPPALRWRSASGEWVLDGARGVALGVTGRPEFHQTAGELVAGDALMLYTDGVIEARTQSVTEGIEWLRETGRDIVSSSFSNAPKRILARAVCNDDDRAILVINRTG